MNDKREFCCDYLASRLAEKDTYIGYSNSFREFYLERPGTKSVITIIRFCPGCGKKFPKGLRKEWFDILEKEYNIKTDIMERKNRSDIPQEFKSEEWGKVRKL